MKKIIFITVTLISILIINNLIHSIYNLWQKRDLVVRAKLELSKQRKENKSLKSSLAFAQSKGFVEEEARNKLFLAKPEEREVLIPKDLLKLPLPSKRKESTPNWKKWWDLFF